MVSLPPSSRTLFVLSATICLLPALSGAQVAVETGKAGSSQGGIKAVYFDVSQLHHDAASNGDTWDYAWADDDALYSFNCDGRGYGKEGRNVSFNKLVGDRWNELTGISVNPMDYGKGGERAANLSNWKTTGADSIDGALYAFVANNWYGDQNAYGGPEPDHNIRQTVKNMSLIRSADHGRTWTRDAATNYAHPMWTSRKFSTAFFVKYGKDGGNTRQDDQDKYVYAISNDGYWNCGSHFYLGRVPRSQIARLQASDWEFYADGKWTRDVEAATALPGFANGQMKETMGSPLWVARLHKYVTVTWFDPGTTERWHFPQNVTFALYEADHPWGPWTWVGEKSASDFIADRKSRIHRWYGPSLCPRFITENQDGSVTVILTFSGQTWEGTPQSLYKNNSLPVTFYTSALPKEVTNFNDADARFSGDWTYEPNTGRGDYDNDAHTTTTPNAEADFDFTGSGIELLSEKSRDMGTIEVVLDGQSRGTVSLYQDPMPLLYQVEVYRNLGLAPVRHSLRVINRSRHGKRIVIDGFRVYGAMDFDSSSHYWIRNRETGNVLLFRNGVLTAAPNKLTGDRTEWQIHRTDQGLYGLALVNLQRALGNSDVDGRAALVPVTADPGRAHTLWRIRPVGNGTFSIVNGATDLSLSEVPAAPSQSSLAQLQYMGRDAQKWEIVRSDAAAN